MFAGTQKQWCSSSHVSCQNIHRLESLFYAKCKCVSSALYVEGTKTVRFCQYLSEGCGVQMLRDQPPESAIAFFLGSSTACRAQVQTTPPSRAGPAIRRPAPGMISSSCVVRAQPAVPQPGEEKADTTIAIEKPVVAGRTPSYGGALEDRGGVWNAGELSRVQERDCKLHPSCTDTLPGTVLCRSALCQV